MSIELMDAADMRRTLGRMAHEIIEANGGVEDLVVVGILRRGWPIAKRIAFSLTQIEGTTIPCGKLDIRSYRDDREGQAAPVELPPNETEIPFELKGRKVLLVDEVIFTGRSVRAALDGLMKHGRPKEVQLAVLVDRGHRELPIAPTFCGRALATERSDHVVVKVHEIDGEDSVVLTKNKELLEREGR